MLVVHVLLIVGRDHLVSDIEMLEGRRYRRRSRVEYFDGGYSDLAVGRRVVLVNHQVVLQTDDDDDDVKDGSFAPILEFR